MFEMIYVFLCVIKEDHQPKTLFGPHSSCDWPSRYSAADVHSGILCMSKLQWQLTYTTHKMSDLSNTTAPHILKTHINSFICHSQTIKAGDIIVTIYCTQSGVYVNTSQLIKQYTYTNQHYTQTAHARESWLEDYLS